MTATNTPTRTVIQVSAKDLPLSCPPSTENMVSMHPRVFLSIKKTGKAACPYCGAAYELKD